MLKGVQKGEDPKSENALKKKHKQNVKIKH